MLPLRRPRSRRRTPVTPPRADRDRPHRRAVVHRRTGASGFVQRARRRGAGAVTDSPETPRRIVPAYARAAGPGEPHAADRLPQRPPAASQSTCRAEHGERAGVERVAAQLRPREPRAVDEPHAHARAGRARSAASAPAGPAPTMTTSSSGRSHSPRAPEHERAVLRSEAEAVAQRRIDLRRPGPTLGRKSRSQAGSGSVEVDRRRQEAAIERQGRRHDAGRAAGALRMSDHRLGRRAGSRSASGAERAPRAARLDRVVQLRGRAVVVHVADLVERAARLRHRRSACSARSRRRRGPSARGGRHRRSRHSRRPWRRCARRGPAPGPRARAPPSTRLRRARTRRGPCRTGARPRPAGRCSGSRRRASARSRRSCPAARSRRCRPTAARRRRRPAAAPAA